MKRYAAFTILPLILLLHHVAPSFAFDMSNGSYSIDQSNLDDSIPTPTLSVSNTSGVADTQKQPPAPAIISDSISTNAKDNKSPLSVSLSPDTVTFGTVYPTDPILRTQTIHVETGASDGYSVFLSEDHALLSPANQFIPDTTCDDGLCSEKNTSTWANTLTYGFGFTCECTSGNCETFLEKDSFKHLPNKDKHQLPQLLYKQLGKGSATQSLTYKLNTSATQPNGAYVNTVNIMVVSTY